MRKINLNAMEASLTHAALNMGDPQRGLSMQEIRDMVPLLDMIEAQSSGQGMQRVFKSIELTLKESQWEQVKNKIAHSSGWISVESGRVIMKLEDKIKESPYIPEPVEERV